MTSTLALVISVSTAVILAGTAGWLAGWLLTDSIHTSQQQAAVDASEYILNNVKPDLIAAHLRNLTSVPSLAGTPEDLKQAEYLRDTWLEYGLDEVSIVPYDVLLSYPDSEIPNKVYLLDSEGNEVFSTEGWQPCLSQPEENSSRILPNYNAYSAPGTVQGELVYVNYGRLEDFEFVTSLGIDLTGKIVLARYGAIFRSNIAKVAEEFGGAGLVLFGDPKDYAQEGRDFVYPDSIWLPGMGVQTGTLNPVEGDPLTPLYPSTDGAYRLPESQAKLPRIPVQPIGYDEAEMFLKQMTGPEAPADWQGELDTVYKIGPGLQNGQTVKLEVHTKNKVATTYNVIGSLHGEIEPDRYVLIGNHRDTWSIPGSVDPLSGTAAMLELIRVYAKLHKEQGWRPRRSLVFCNWGAEEQNVLGSVEWVEEHMHSLTARAVIYLNADLAIQGNASVRALGMPTVYDVLYEAAKKIPNPNPEEIAAGRDTVYDTWHHTFPDQENSQLPEVIGVGSGSDYFAFMHYIGIPSVDIRYTYTEDMPLYPLYHTVYETFFLMNDLYDQGFFYSASVTKMWGLIANAFADSNLLPFNLQNYGQFMTREVAKFESKYGAMIKDEGISLDWFKWAAGNFSQATSSFQEKVLPKVNLNNAHEVRTVNDQLMLLERAFIDPRGLPNRPGMRHVVNAPSSADSYSPHIFPGLSDILEDIKLSENDPELWKDFKKHLSQVVYLINSATQTLSTSLHNRSC